VVGLICALSCTWVGASIAASQADERPPGHRRMVAALAEIARWAPDAWHPGIGTRMLREMREHVPGERVRPADRIRHLTILAILELAAAEPDRSLEALERASALVDLLPEEERPRARAELLFWQGVQAMRVGEDRNCVARHSSASCLVPLRGDGVHADKEPGKRAIARFTEAIALAPGDSWVGPSSRWLLNIAYMTIGKYPASVPAALRIPFVSEGPFPRFPEVAAAAGVAVRNYAGSAIADDFDGDGLLDIFIGSWEPGGQVRYFRNLGDGRFADRTKEAGLEGLSGGVGAVHADFDGDGDLDILVLRGGWLRKEGRWPNSLLQNDGSARFTDVTFESGLAEVSYPTQTAAWADYDRDGDLDLYVGNEGAETDPARGGYPSQLFRNDGGRFTDVAEAAGVQNLRFAKGVAWGDYDNDGWPDLYVSNLQGPNRLYHSNRDGTFTDVAVEAGVQEPYESFATWFWDFDQDGALDLFVDSYPTHEGKGIFPPPLWRVVRSRLGEADASDLPKLYKGDGRGGFRDVTREQHLDRITMSMGSAFADLDNDGYPDAYLGTGYPGLEGLVPNVLYHNQRGKGFRDVAVAAGMAHLQKGHGVAVADLDNDGDVDVFHEIGGFFVADNFVDALFENPGTKNHWLTLELRSAGANRFAVGARIRVDFEDGGRPRSVHRVVGGAGSFGSRPMREEIGLSGAKVVKRLEIVWPRGATQTFENLPVDRFLRVTEGVDRVERLSRPSFRFASR
jgi:FG-GAP-like repeat/ASPIC and UnbV